MKARTLASLAILAAVMFWAGMGVHTIVNGIRLEAYERGFEEGVRQPCAVDPTPQKERWGI